jgi:divalent metal cation (Fe/Co/Zn/Cd) transporter
LVSPSARVVYAALAGDLAVAAAKFGASALSGSTAMLTEAIHSLVDSADQILLLTGQSRARKAPVGFRCARCRCGVESRG